MGGAGVRGETAGRSSAGDLPDALRSARRWLIAVGAASIVAGALAILIPAVASVTIAIFIGWLLVAVGALMLSHAIASRTEGRVWRIVHAVLTIVVGICLVAFPLTGTLTLTFFLAGWFLASGVVHLVAAWQLRSVPGIGWTAFDGALSLVLGLLIALDLPSSASWAIGLLVGVGLMFFGIRALVAAGVLRTLLDDRARSRT
jgi:uncharacterized membrane protein HdeD (DUF308 family)